MYNLQRSHGKFVVNSWIDSLDFRRITYDTMTTGFEQGHLESSFQIPIWSCVFKLRGFSLLSLCTYCFLKD